MRIALPFDDGRGRALAAWLLLLPALSVPAADFSRVEALLQEHCVECHSAKDAEGGLALDSFDGLLKGGETGASVVPGKAADSLLIQAVEGTWGRTGKNQFMPPGKRDRLPASAVAAFREWIEAGAPAPVAATGPRELNVPRIEPRTPPRRPVRDLAFEPGSKLLAVARPDAVELVSVDSRTVVRSLTGFRGSAQAVVFSANGQSVFAGAGDVTGGEIVEWRIPGGERGRSYTGHGDAVHSLAFSGEGPILAGGGYDHGIRLWHVADGRELATIAVNQGAVMGLAFRPDGRVLASASYDRTARLYAMPSGERLETFGQALQEVHAVAFSPDGRTLLTGGGDHRIRAYRIGPDGREGSNELVATVFAHEGTLLRLGYSPDGRLVASSSDDGTVKLLDAATLVPLRTLEPQPDWPLSLVFAGDALLVVGRADGSLGFYDPQTGRPAPPPRPELVRLEPAGAERGRATRIRLVGRNLEQAPVIRVHRDGALAMAVAAEWEEGSPWVTVAPPSDERPGKWELSLGDGTTESGRIPLWVDDLPQRTMAAHPAVARLEPLEQVEWPVSVWATMVSPGSAVEFEFSALAGQRLVLDVAAQRLGAKGDYALTVMDAAGRTLGFNASVDGQPDPTLVIEVPSDGQYRVRVEEETYAGSADHRFRLSLGELPLVTGMFPLGVSAGHAAVVQLFGVNLPDEGRIQVPPLTPGEHPLPVPAADWRTRQNRVLSATVMPSAVESEPNDAPAEANPVSVPASVNGTLGNAGLPDRDCFRFFARHGVTYVIETSAARQGSPADTRIAVLWPDGRPVERVRLQSVLNSVITFRPETSDDPGIRFENWEEMELNDLLWCGGEVMKIFRAPQGPDSDTLLYSNNGRRVGFFDTTPMAHPVDRDVYLVRPLDAGANPVPNGLPGFTVHFENDDAALRDMGTDSRVMFLAPADGAFVVEVTDARDFSGADHTYRLVIREAEPSFVATLQGAPSMVAAGSGQGFTVAVERRDGFDGPVHFAVNHPPPGWTLPESLMVEAGHDRAQGVLYAAADAVQPPDAAWDAVTVVATAEVEARPVAVAVNSLGRPRLSPEPARLRVHLEPVTVAEGEESIGLPRVALTPGGTARAHLRIERLGFDGVVTFSVDNLPHGVIVENLGLNGITFLADETGREISIAAARWVAPMERPFHAVENQAGRQASRPLLLQVHAPVMRAAAP